MERVSGGVIRMRASYQRSVFEAPGIIALTVVLLDIAILLWVSEPWILVGFIVGILIACMVGGCLHMIRRNANG